jgi:cytochrome c oxidase cbb3-type subunit 3
MQKEAMLKTVAATVDESSVVALKDEASLSLGKSIFIARCSPCHSMNAEGNVGPNLTDDYWLHGGSVNDIFKTVKYGVPAKAMVAWNGILQPIEMQDVVSYIMSLRGSNPANAKAPQGTLYVPGTSPFPSDSTAGKIESPQAKI